jgi:hypothetical protein
MVSPPQRHRQTCIDELDVLDRGRLPSHDGPQVQIDDERDIHEPAQCQHVSEVHDPTMVRERRREIAVQDVSSRMEVRARYRFSCSGLALAR